MSQDTSKRINAALRAVTGRNSETSRAQPPEGPAEQWMVVDGVAFKAKGGPADEDQKDGQTVSGHAGSGTGTQPPGGKPDMNKFIRLAAGKVV